MWQSSCCVWGMVPRSQSSLRLVSTGSAPELPRAGPVQAEDRSGQSAGALPLERLRQMANEFSAIVEAWSCTYQDVENIRGLVARLVDHIHIHPEMCLGMARRLALQSPAMQHAFNVAVAAVLVGQALDLKDAQQLTIARAALAMNLSSFQLQDDLSSTRASLSFGQRINIARHPILAAELLAHTPGADIQWIEAVEQHHEAIDGTGYPFGIAGEEICIEARVLKAADIWCALLSSRPTRPGKYPHDAMQELLTRERMRLDMSVLATLRRLLGNYPPGTLVRLASRETAVVTNFTQGNAGPRRVVAVLNAAGEVMVPALRDTGKTANLVRSYTYIPSHHPRMPRWEKVWSLG